MKQFLDENGYPTKRTLKKIEKWDVIKDIHGLVDFIEKIWWNSELLFHLKKGKDIMRRSILKLELHTGGWSGNEDIIRSLENQKFGIFSIYWEKSIRGGHYYFEIPLRMKEVK